MATRQELVAAFDLMRSAAVRAGVEEAARWHLEVGSKTYGRAYRIWLKSSDESKTGHYTPVICDFLGMTASEAFETIHHYRSAFNAVQWSR